MAAQVAELPRFIIELLILTPIHSGNDHRSSGTILATRLPPNRLVLVSVHNGFNFFISL